MQDMGFDVSDTRSLLRVSQEGLVCLGWVGMSGRWVCPAGVGMSRGMGMSRGGYVKGVGMSRGWVCPWGEYVWVSISWTWHTTGYGRQAGGTHPTGMLSCWK